MLFHNLADFEGTSDIEGWQIQSPRAHTNARYAGFLLKRYHMYTLNLNFNRMFFPID